MKVIIWKELRQFAIGPTYYFSTAIFLLLWEYLYFRDVFLAGEASLRALFAPLPWLMLLMIPALTMGSFAKEENDGTLEYLMTHPIGNAVLVGGKYIASLVSISAVIIFAVPVAFAIDRHGDVEWSVVGCQVLAGIGLASVLISLGMLMSTLVRNQVASLLMSALGSLVLIAAGLDSVATRIPSGMVTVLSQASVSAHFNSMIRGVIDLRDVWYFIATTAIFLCLAYLRLCRRQFGNHKESYSYTRTVSLASVSVLLLSVALMSLQTLRIDATHNNLYSLSPGTKTTLAKIDRTVTITLYASEKLPASIQATLRDTKDILHDYVARGGRQIKISFKNPDSTKKLAAEAQKNGVQQVQFNTVEKEELKLKKGYLGLSITVGKKTRAIPYIDDQGKLEYQLTSAIADLTTPKKKVVYFLTGHGAKTADADLALFATELKKQFTVKSLKINSKKRSIPTDATTVIVAGPTSSVGKITRNALFKYAEAGGSILLMIDGAVLDFQRIEATEGEKAVRDTAKSFGFTVGNDVVFDTNANVTATFNNGTQSFQLPYMFWPRPDVAKSHPVSRSLSNIVMPWSSSLKINRKKLKENNLKLTVLLKTTEAGGLQAPPFKLRPQEQFNATKRGKINIAAAATGTLPGGTKPARIVVISNSVYIADSYLKSTQTPANIAFGLQAVSWLGEQSAIASIQAKSSSVAELRFKTASQKSFAKYANLGLAILIPAALAAWQILRRRRLAKRVYSR